MLGRILISLIILLGVFPGHARADVEIERFTSSISQVYRVSVMCSKTQVFDSANFTRIIVSYLTQYYPEGVPYWALPDVSERVRDRRICGRMISASLSNYREASNDFLDRNPDEPIPPVISLDMLAGTRSAPSLNVVSPYGR